MSGAQLVRQIQRFLKCLEHPEFDKQQTQTYLTQQLFILRPNNDQKNATLTELLDYIGSLGPRQVCQYQVSFLLYSYFPT